MNPIVIECRSKDGEIYNGNSSDFSTTLQQKIEIDEGDSIVIRNSFLDTESASNQKININDNLTINGSCILYKNFLVKNGITMSSAIDPDNQIDGTEYFLCYQVPNQDKDKFYEQKEVKVRAYGSQTRGFGNFDFTVRYKQAQSDGNGPMITSTFTAPFGDTSTGPATIYGTTGFFYDPTGGDPVIISPSKHEQEDQYFSVLTLEPGVPVPDDSFQIVENHFTAEVPKGNYSPEDLCSLINRQLNKNSGPSNELNPPEPRDNINPVVSPFLQTTSNLNGGRPNAFFWRSDGGMWFTNEAGQADLYAGTSQVELAWNQDQQIFLWNYLHMPYYDGPDEASGIGVSRHTDGNFTRFKLTKNSGICFTKLNALNDLGDDDGGEFWFNTLGFTRDVVINYAYVDIPTGIDYAGRAPKIVDTLTEGVNMTGGYFGLDTVVPKPSSSGDLDFMRVPSLGTSFLSTITDTTPINASQSSLNAQYNFGYFLIDVESQFKHDYLTPNQNFRNICSVVGRYFEVNSYTTGTDGIVYTHKGQPLLLEGFRIRILQSDKQLALLGDDNTIIFEVIKSSK